jgi:hypothetical protein
MSTPIQAHDLTQRPPRSMRVRLDGYAILPRVLDKCRALLVGKIGEYKFNCPLDQHFLKFTGIEAEALKAEVAKGLGDSEILAWVQSASSHPRSPWEIQQWSAYHDHRGPDSDAETLAYFANSLSRFSKTREDINTWADLLDLDDHVSFGGQA